MKKLGNNQNIYFFLLLKIGIKKAKTIKNQLKNLKMM